GDALYVFAGNGTGSFDAPGVIHLPGTMTALAAGNFGRQSATSVVLGVAGPHDSFSLLVYDGTKDGLVLSNNYLLGAAASSFAFGNLAGGADVAVVSGGQVRILNGSTRQLENISLPVTVSAVVVGSFIHDRNAGQQMAL